MAVTERFQSEVHRTALALASSRTRGAAPFSTTYSPGRGGRRSGPTHSARTKALRPTPGDLQADKGGGEFRGVVVPAGPGWLSVARMIEQEARDSGFDLLGLAPAL